MKPIILKNENNVDVRYPHGFLHCKSDRTNKGECRSKLWYLSDSQNREFFAQETPEQIDTLIADAQYEDYNIKECEPKECEHKQWQVVDQGNEYAGTKVMAYCIYCLHEREIA